MRDPEARLVLCVVCLTVGLACSEPPTRTSILQQAPSVPDTRSLVTPLRPTDAIRLRYAIPRSLDGQGEHGRVEAGSRAAFSVLRFANRLAVDGQAARWSELVGASVAERVVELVRGDDGRLWTGDDRPFVSLADLQRRAKPDTFDLGRLIHAARLSGLGPPADPSAWRVSEAVAMSGPQAQRMLSWVEGCGQARLEEVLGKRATEAIAQRKPFEDLSAFGKTPYVGRVEVARALHHSEGELCATPKAHFEKPIPSPLPDQGLGEARWEL